MFEVVPEDIETRADYLERINQIWNVHNPIEPKWRNFKTVRFHISPDALSDQETWSEELEEVVS